MKKNKIIVVILCLLTFFSCQQEKESFEIETSIPESSYELQIIDGILEFPSFEVYDEYVMRLNHDHTSINAQLEGFKSLKKSIDQLTKDFYEKDIVTEELNQYFKVSKSSEGKVTLELDFPFYNQSLFLNGDGIVKIGNNYFRFSKHKVAYSNREEYRTLLAGDIDQIEESEEITVSEVSSTLFNEENKIQSRGTLEECFTTNPPNTYSLGTRFIGNQYCINGQTRIIVEVWISKQQKVWWAPGLWWAYNSGWAELVNSGGAIKLAGGSFLYDAWNPVSITISSPNGPYLGNYSFTLYSKTTTHSCSFQWEAITDRVSGTGDFPDGNLSCQILNAAGVF